MRELLQSGTFCVLLTLAAYQIGLFLQKKLCSPLCNPILIGVILVLGVMAVTGLSNSDYQAGIRSVSWLLTPATVCLAIPIYEQLQVLRKNLRAVLAGVVSGAVSCLMMVLLLCLAFGFDRELTISLLPKSVTTAIGLPLSQLSGGIGSLTTAAIILTGILANILSPSLCRLFRLTDPVAAGVAMGTSGHVIATAKANEMSALTGAVSSLSLVTAGLLTTVLFPISLQLIP